MRLLQIKTNGEFSLTKDLVNDIPPYAILSHTWGDDDEEITFQDIAEGSSKTKAGYRKLQFCANQAGRDGLQHFWVDTCCIDKSSSAVLNEAINSMFRWYRNAAKCYVYLSDVSLNYHNQSSLSSQSWEAAFRNSRWFTRGWTLQELIAPPTVEFYSSDGKRLGDKISLKRQVHEVTGVAIGALDGDALSEFSVAERMSWAKNRKTTREEDKAYSLLGIFNIYLPLIYGEGEQSALRRLQKEIDSRPLSTQTPMQRSPQRLQSPPPPPSPSAIIPYRRDRDFVERSALKKILQRDSEPGTRVGLVGLGGVGKSQLAIEYAYRVRETSPDAWVFWVHASSAIRFEESYRNIAAGLRLPGWNKPEVDVLGIVHRWLLDESNGRWTMVLDNADDAAVLLEPWNREVNTTTAAASPAHSLSDFLPLSSHGMIVITSRSQEVLKRLQVFRDDIVEVEPMEVDVAKTLLVKKLKNARRDVSSDDMVRLVKHLECMPLAVTQAAAYIEQAAPRMTVRKYVKLLEEDDRERAVLLQKDIQDPRRDRQASNSIIKTWYVTFTHLQQTRDSAARLLALMSLFDREAIPDNLLQGRYVDASNNKTDFEDDIVTLREYSLIGIGVSENLFDMHRLVQLSTQKWLETHAELEEWQARYINILGAAFPTGDYANWTTCQALFPHVEAMERHRVTDVNHRKVWANVLYKGSWYGRTRGQYEIANRMARACLEAREEIFGFSDAATLSSVNMLAEVLQYQGRYTQAEAMLRRALAGREKTLGVDHISTLRSVSDLGNALQSQGKFTEAEEMNRRALAGTEKTLGVDHPETLASVNNVALVLQHQRKYKQAEEMNRRALAGYEKVGGMDHPDTLTIVYCLAHLLAATHDYDEALKLYERAVIGRRKVLGPEHPRTVACQRKMDLLVEKMERRSQKGSSLSSQSHDVLLK